MSIKAWAAAKGAKLAAGPAGYVLSGLAELARLLAWAAGGWRALLWLAFAVYFALSAQSWKDKAQDLEQRAADAEHAAQLAAAQLAAAQAAVTVKVVTQYVDRVRIVRGRTQTIVKEVPVYVPSDLPVLPGSFRVFHDAAAAGQLPDPAGIADAAAVAPAAVAETVATNYGTCHEVAAQLSALQDWIRAQAAVK